MGGLVAGGKSAVECGGGFRPERGRLCGFVLRDGDVKIWAANFGIERESYQPCSARNRDRICKARWRAASFCCGLDGAAGEGGLEGLGA
jgi:hypothetical protein